MWSATQQRDAVQKGDYAAFKSGLPPEFPEASAMEMYQKTRKAYGLAAAMRSRTIEEDTWPKGWGDGEDDLEAYSPDQPRDDRGRWTDGGGGGAKAPATALFLSPNIAENLTFDQARAQLSSARQEKFRKMAAAYAGHYGKQVTVANVIGDWSDGAENSLYIEARMKPEEVRYVAAKLGAAAGQKAVIPFVARTGGKDALWTVNADGSSMEKARAVLNRSGLQYRTLEQRGDNLMVHIFDQGGGLRGNVLKAADGLGGAPVHVKRGEGEFLGGDTREAGRKAYSEVIRNYRGRKLAAAAGKPAKPDPAVVDDTAAFLAGGRNAVIILGLSKPKTGGKTKDVRAGVFSGDRSQTALSLQ
jgi:hypothetical protein